MKIEKLVINNFKCYEDNFVLPFNEDVNIVVGNNEAGKSTILEAVHLVLTGMLNGRYLRNDLSQYLFNNKVTKNYIQSLKSNSPSYPPRILIELYIKDDGSPEAAILKGNGNSNKQNTPGVLYEILFDESYMPLYEDLVKRQDDVDTIPIEYYKVSRRSFARKEITSQVIPIKSALIDSTGARNQNGSDLYISRIIRNNLEDSEKVDISQAHRKMKEEFMKLPSVSQINKKIGKDALITDKEITISVDLASQNAWESGLITYLDDVPFHYIGKGEQSIVKTALALGHKKSKEANVVLMEEPENHLSHTKLNELLQRVISSLSGKQIILSTHSSFVANKLGLRRLLFLHNSIISKLSDLSPDTAEFFEKLPGYNILRLILCRSAVLVEGDCDELIFQRAFKDKNGKLPIECGIDVISVGTSFLRFLEIADKIEKKVVVITDNDGDVEAIEKKYSQYIGSNKKEYIDICYESIVHNYTGMLEKYNNNTLEPELLRANHREVLSNIVVGDKSKFKNDDDLLEYMKNNKTKCALRIFKTQECINYPAYIEDAVSKV